MRSSLFVVLLALLVLTVSAVPVPYKWCGSSKDDATVESIISNEFPPVKGTTLTLNVTGNLSKQVTSGTYKIVITVGGFPLPDQTGDIAMFRPLPWPVGDLNITYQQEIPSVAPPGAYTVKISAVDQDGTQIFCLTIAFTLSERSGGERGEELEAAQRVAELPTSPFNALRTSELIRHTRPTNNIQRLKPITKMPAMRPLRRL